jgi:hypothetical protein
MRMGMGVAMLCAALAAGCTQAGGGEAPSGERAQKARADSIRDEQQALIDSGVTVDTQVIDTGAPRPTPAADN